MRKVAFGFVMALLFIAFSGNLVRAQGTRDFFRRTEEEGYLNYGAEEYKAYERELMVRKKYDYLGNFLMEGYEVYTLDERRPGLDQPGLEGSVIFKHSYYNDWFNNLIITKDSYRGWKTTATVGDAIRTKFTSLTLKLSRFNGIRWDAASPKNKFTVLGSRGYPDLFSTPVKGGGSNRVIEVAPIYIFGVHWQTQLGDILKLGATYINQHQVDATKPANQNSIKGTIPEMLPPDTLIVRFTDDSPEDGRAGAAVFSCYITVKGKIGDQDTILSSNPASPYYSPFLAPTVVGGYIPPGASHIEANGTEAVDYIFPIPSTIVGTPVYAEFEAVVANDYRISLKQRHTFYDPKEKELVPRGAPCDPSPDATDAMSKKALWRGLGWVVARADGNVQDYTNKKRLKFEYLMPTGQDIYGIDFEANLVGLKIKGEYENNVQYGKFPVVKGRRGSEEHSAYYINVVKDIGQTASLGAEYFRISPGYGGGYISSRSGMVFYTDRGGKDANEASTSEFPLVEDNDDNDQWPDDSPADYPTGGQMDSGVYPGLDKNNDDIPDTDQNSNGIPDYEEPSMLYYSDPQEFVYGIDFNNNGIIDERENDDKPDYPYDRNLEGYHYFMLFKPIKGMKVTFGHYNMHQIADAGVSTANYIKFSYMYDFPRIGQFEINYDGKRVKDDIPDPVYIFQIGGGGAPTSPPPKDILPMRNSAVHTYFSQFRYTQIPNLSITDGLQYVYNHKYPSVFKDGTTQDGDITRRITNAFRIDYTLKLGKLTIMPMVKHLMLKRSSDRIERETGKAIEEWTQFAPILRVDYKLTPNTTIRFGQQGFRLAFFKSTKWRQLLAFKYRDKVSPYNDRSETDMLFMVSNLSDYWGYKIAANVGFQRKSIEYSDEERAKLENARYTRYFISVVVGY